MSLPVVAFLSFPEHFLTRAVGCSTWVNHLMLLVRLLLVKLEECWWCFT